MKPREIVGYRIREERTRLGMSQAQLAKIMTDLIGTTWYPQTVGAAEQGQRAFTIDDLFAIRYALAVSLDDLTTPPPGEPIESPSGIPWAVPSDSDVGIEALLVNDVERAVQELRTYLDKRRRGEATP